MRTLMPLFLLFAAACGDDTTTTNHPPDAAIGVTCGASVCPPAELCCPGLCGDPKPFCAADSSCPEAGCDLGPTTD